MSSVLPTGTQYRISSGDCTAVIAEVGATLRSLTWAGRELCLTYGDDEPPLAWVGSTLVPWPNRIRDGRYTFDGTEYQLPINEPTLGTALHGLAAAIEWRLVRRDEASLTLASIVHPQLGWAGSVRTACTWRVDDEGLTAQWRATNVGRTPLPFGYGAHPYLAFADVADVELAIPFANELLVDERLLPVEIADVTDGHDFREPRRVGDGELDTAYTGGPEEWQVTLTGPEHAVTVWADAHHPWMQVHTHPNRRAIAVEPMTCGPNAFNEGPTHSALLRLEPGETASGRWGIRPAH